MAGTDELLDVGECVADGTPGIVEACGRGRPQTRGSTVGGVRARRVYGGDWEEMPAAVSTGLPGARGGGQPAARAAAFAAAERDAMADAAEAAAQGWKPLVDPVLDPIFRAVRESENWTQFRAALDAPEALDADGRQPLGAALARRAFGAALSGEAGLDEK